jgi:hypothetical protein
MQAARSENIGLKTLPDAVPSIAPKDLIVQRLVARVELKLPVSHATNAKKLHKKDLAKKRWLHKLCVAGIQPSAYPTWISFGTMLLYVSLLLNLGWSVFASDGIYISTILIPVAFEAIIIGVFVSGLLLNSIKPDGQINRERIAVWTAILGVLTLGLFLPVGLKTLLTGYDAPAGNILSNAIHSLTIYQYALPASAVIDSCIAMLIYALFSIPEDQTIKLIALAIAAGFIAGILFAHLIISLYKAVLRHRLKKQAVNK